MENQTVKTKPDLKAVSKCYGISVEDLNKLDAYYSVVYEFSRNGKDYILKCIEADNTSPGKITGELHYLQFLSENGINVSTPVESEDNNLFETQNNENGETVFFYIVYTKAEGDFAFRTYDRNNYPDSFIKALGREIGKLHRVVKDYKPTASCIRPEWKDTVDFFPLDDFPESEKKVVDRYIETMEKIDNLKITGNNYGLIHNDIHDGNFFIKDNRFIFFDFEEASPIFFANDIAIPLFYAVWKFKDQKEKDEYGAHFLKTFMSGYKLENNLDSESMDSISLFLKIREMDNYSMDYDVTDFKGNKGLEWFMANRKERLENGTPYLNIPYSDYK